MLIHCFLLLTLLSSHLLGFSTPSTSPKPRGPGREQQPSLQSPKTSYTTDFWILIGQITRTAALTEVQLQMPVYIHVFTLIHYFYRNTSFTRTYNADSSHKFKMFNINRSLLISAQVISNTVMRKSSGQSRLCFVSSC